MRHTVLIAALNLVRTVCAWAVSSAPGRSRIAPCGCVVGRDLRARWASLHVRGHDVPARRGAHSLTRLVQVSSAGRTRRAPLARRRTGPRGCIREWRGEWTVMSELWSVEDTTGHRTCAPLSSVPVSVCRATSHVRYDAAASPDPERAVARGAETSRRTRRPDRRRDRPRQQPQPLHGPLALVQS